MLVLLPEALRLLPAGFLATTAVARTVDDVLAAATTWRFLLLVTWSIALALSLSLAHQDARALRAAGMARPFPWGWPLLAPWIYVIGRHLRVRRVANPSPAPFVTQLVLLGLDVLGVLGGLGLLGAASALVSG